MNAVSPPPAGWYPDPSGRAPFRYWDGARWTEHTDQGTAPSPSPTAPAAPAAPSSAPTYTPAAPGYPPASPGYPPAAPAYQQAAPGYAPATAMATAAPAGANWNAQTFMADVKRLDGLALVVVGAIVFLLASFLPWAEGTARGVDRNTGLATEVSDSGNAWDDEGTPWLIRGFEVKDLINQQAGTPPPDSGTDMVILLPLALIAVGAAAGSRLGKQTQYTKEIVLGAAGLLSVLMIAEAVHVSGEIDDLSAAYTAIGATFDGGLTFGFYIGILCALVMAGGAVKHYLANKQTKA